MGPSRFDLGQLLSELRNRQLPMESVHGQYDMPPGWQFRKFPEQGMHPAIARMQQAEQSTPADSKVQFLMDEWQNDPAKQKAFLQWYFQQQANSRRPKPYPNPEEYF